MPVNKTNEITFLKSETDLGVFTLILLVNLIGIVLINISYQQKYKEINDFMDFFADTDLPEVPEGAAKRFKITTYFNFAKKNLRMLILMALMAWIIIEAYWPKFLRVFPEFDDLAWKILGGFLSFLSISAIFAAPIHSGKKKLYLI